MVEGTCDMLIILCIAHFVARFCVEQR
jgi:hypothetical protein